MTIQQYLTKINTLFQTGNAREHSYRGDLQNLLMAILPDILVTNEPARVQCGAPDYVLTRKDVPIGYIEAKDIGVDLGSKTLKEQFDRYKSGLSNLIFTDYLDFHFYKDGQFITKIAIARIEFPSSGGVSEGRGGQIIGIPENFEQFTNLIQNFALTVSQTIKSPTQLAQMMAGKAKLMADVIEKSLNYDDEQNSRSNIKSQMLSFQQMLIHDINNKSFADIYSQTIAYGMFAARYHDPTLKTFSRQEAATLIPKSNPFLRKLFQDIAGYDLDTRLDWIVEELVTIFLASDVEQIMRNFGKSTKQEDPVVHFYETFLGEYNPALRKARGVWYTPQPVVNFIVRAVDDILKTEFNLPQGLADTSKIKIKKKAVTQSKGKDAKIKEVETEVEVHRVQILDPATGTGTFLAEVVKHIHKKFEGQQGIWSKYVTNDLIPRLNGFELLMASYAMAHLKMDMLLTETGYKPQQFPSSGGVSEGRGGSFSGETQRIKIFLTNSLEEAHPDSNTLFSSWLSDEADQANAIKRDAPVMVVIGNPPYSGESANKGEWIMNLMEDYKKEPGGKEKLKERNPKMINDDYVKFMRFGQHFIDKNGSGILAFINPHGFLDNPTFRGMRWNLLKTYDKLYTIDLHGNSRKNEISPDGSVDQNVFDIMQGVSINLLIKTGKKKVDELGEVFHHDLYGKRDLKYNFLSENTLHTIVFKKVKNINPDYYFIPKDYKILIDYELGFSINQIFNIKSSGIKTSNDASLVSFDKEKLIEIVKLKFDININERLIKKYSYKPFIEKFIYYDDNLIGRSRKEFMSNFFDKENYGICIMRNLINTDSFSSILISKNLLDINFYGFQTYSLPLYLYPETNSQQNLLETSERIPNLNPEIIKEMAKGLGMSFVHEPFDSAQGDPSSTVCFANSEELRPEFRLTFAPIDVLDYIYAVLHSPSYREKYKEFLKIDFPRVPYPTNIKTFWQLVKLGGELRAIHLLESEVVEKYITQYPEDGDNIVVKPKFVKTSDSNSPPSEGCPQDGVVKNTPIYFNTIIDLPYNSSLKERAHALRYAENLSEVLFWMQVHKGKFYNIDFDRQRIIGNYIVDFYVKKLGLVVEIDGSSHDDRKDAYDTKRDEYLQSLGLKVHRIPVTDVLQNMAKAKSDLADFIVANYSAPPRLTGTPPREGNLGNVFINETQYFSNVPELAWNFYIGGYQPAQKWLKDRKGRELSYKDILHYQKIIVALNETDRIMKEIDKVEI